MGRPHVAPSTTTTPLSLSFDFGNAIGTGTKRTSRRTAGDIENAPIHLGTGKAQVEISQKGDPCRCSTGVFLLSLLCVIGFWTLIIMASYLGIRAAEGAAPVVDVILPTMQSAQELMGHANVAAHSLDDLMNASVVAVEHAVPAADRVVTMLDETAGLVDRVNRLVAKPSITLSMSGVE